MEHEWHARTPSEDEDRYIFDTTSFSFRRQKQRRKSTLIGPEYLQRAHEMHQLRNEKPSNPNSHQKTNVSEMNAGDVDAADPSNTQDGQNTCHLRQGSARSSGKPCSLTDCCSVNEALTSSGQRASLDSRNSSNLNTSGEYVMVENNSLKIYVTNDDGKLTIPRTKLNKNPGTVLEGVDIPALYHHNTTPTEADCGDYDNMMFGNCGDQESNQSEAPTSWQTHLNKSEPEVLCDDVYDNVQYEENHGHLVTGLGREELMSQFPVEPDDGMGNHQPQCHNLTNADFGLLYDNVEFSEGCGNIVDNGSEASNQGECNLDYDNVDFNEGHGEVVEVVEKGIVRLQSRSLPVIYEYDEGISMENDEYDYVDEGQGQDEAMTLREADAVNNGANQVVNNENNHGIPLPQGQRKVLQGHEESSVQSPAQGLSNLGQGHSDFENMVNKLILDQEADASRENNKQDLYESLQHSSFQKPVDYGMKLNMLHHQADGRPRVRGQGHISPPVSEQTPLSGVIDKDVYPSSCDYSQSSIHDEGDYLEPIPYRRPTDNDLSQGQGAQGYFPSGNSNDKDIFQSDEYY